MRPQFLKLVFAMNGGSMARMFLVSMVASFALSACGEPAATGVPVPIPQVYIDCNKPGSNCKTNDTSRLIVHVVFSTSGCARSDFGYTIAGSSNPSNPTVTCNMSTGCYGPITSWINSSGEEVTTIPSGTYSICARLDYDGSNAGVSQSGDSEGVLDNVTVGEATANQFITIWEDVP